MGTEIIKNENELTITSSSKKNLQRCSRLEQIKQRLNANKNKSRNYGTNISSMPNENTVNNDTFVSNKKEMPISNENTNVTVVSGENKSIDAEEVNDKKHASDNYQETIQNLEKKYKIVIEEINES